MSKTVLELVQAACYEVGHPAPSTLVSLTNTSDLMLLHLLYAECRALRNQRGFPQQKRKHTFTLVSGQASYQLPQDYYSPITETQFNQTSERGLIGPVLDSDFVYDLYGPGGSQVDYSYRIGGTDSNPNSTANGQFTIFPTPTASTETIYFEYFSSNLFKPKNWAPSTSYTSGQYVNSSGNIYLCDTNGTSSTTPVSATTQNITDGTTRWDYVSTPYETIVVDTDLCVFDDDIVIAGLKWRIKQAKGLEYEDLNQAYARMLARAKSRWQGSFIGSFAGRPSRPRYRVPYGSWSI